MKIRASFVSNSSSSSFVVKFERFQLSKEYLKLLMDLPESLLWFETAVSSDSIVDRVWEDLQNQLDNQNAIDEYGVREIQVAKRLLIEGVNIVEFDYLTRLAERRIMRMRLSRNKSSETFWAWFSYSDNNGTLETVMEHANIFGSLPHVTFGHH